MSLKDFQEIKDQLRKMESKRTIAVVAAEDAHTLHSVIDAWRNKLISPILLGDKEKIGSLLKFHGLNSEDFEIINQKDPLKCAEQAVNLVHCGQAQGVMKGMIDTSILMKVILDKENNMRTGDLMSLIAFLEIPTYHKLIAITDVGLNMYPSFEQKKMLIKNAVNTFHNIGIPYPKVAVMAAVEKENPKMPETIDARMLKEWHQDEATPDCIVEGPISYDVAISSEAAKIKGFDKPVAGDVDVMIVPDIASGNLLCKSLIFSAGAKSAGLVVGARVPLIIPSRSSTSEDKYLSIAMAALVGSNLGGD